MTAPLRSDWDDERLAAAFAARADRGPGTPVDLAVAVRARLARVPDRHPVGFRRLAPGLGLAATVIVAIAIGAGQLAHPAPAASTRASTSAAAASQSTATSSAPSPSTRATSIVDELLARPITVSEAIARRDANLDDTEIAVEGYAWYPPMAIDCIVSPLQPAPFRGCEYRYTWLAESDKTTAEIISPQPAGPAFNLYVQPETIGASLPQRQPTHVIALGHFDDHRAGTCAPTEIDSCRKDFIVDAIVEPARPTAYRALVTVDRNAGIITSVNDALLFAGLDANDRAIVAAFAIRTRSLADIEPAAADSAELSGVNGVWIVRWVDRGDPSRPNLRTRLVAEDGPDRLGIGSYEVTAVGLEPVAPSSATDGAFDGAPTLVAGLHVMDVGTAIARQSLLVRSEVAIRGWYVPPDPSATCAGRDPLIHPADLPCNAARPWLLEQSERWPAGGEPQPSGPFLNPIVPSDVPLAVPETWADGTPESWPVVIVGHFNDYRVPIADRPASPLIVDALVWQRGGAVSDGSSVVRLTADATDSPETAIARVEQELSPPDVSNRELGPPVLTWTSVVSAAQFGVLEPEISEKAPEFLEARAVWIVRRLVADRYDGQDRLIVDTAYTADGGSRVWLHRADFGEADLETTIDVGPFGANTRLVRVYDYARWIVSVRRATADDSLTWRFTNQEQDGRTRLEVARGATDREVGVRWTGAACALDWRVLVNVYPSAADPGPWIQPQTFGDGCANPGETVTRALIITFDRPIDVDRVRAVDDRCCG